MPLKMLLVLTLLIVSLCFTVSLLLFLGFLVEHDALLEDDVAVGRHFSGGDDSVSRFCPLVELEPLHLVHGNTPSFCLVTNGLIFRPNRDRHAFVLVGTDHVHQNDGVEDVCVERKKLQDCLEELGYPVAVRVHQLCPVRTTRSVKRIIVS